MEFFFVFRSVNCRFAKLKKVLVQGKGDIGFPLDGGYKELLPTKILKGQEENMNRRSEIQKSPLLAKVASLTTIIMLLFFVLPVTSALAAPHFLPALNGEGAMAVSPTSLAYGSTNNTLVFTFSPTVGDFGAGSAVDLIIPAGWTTPTTAAGAGHVTVSSGTCTLSGAPPFGIAGSTISIDMASCTVGQSFTVTYSGVTAPAISGSPYEFITQTDIGPGGEGLTTIASSPKVTISKAPLTVSASGLTPNNKTYDGTTAATLVLGSPSLVGVIGTDDVSLVTASASGAFTNENVGTAKTVNISGLTLGGLDAGNYTLSQPTRTANISARSITVTAVTDTKTYDGTTSSSGTPTLSVGTPLAAGDSAAWNQSFDTKNVGASKTLTPYGVVDDGNSGLNYDYTFTPDVTGEITVANISVTANPQTKTYGAADPTLTYDVTPPLFSGDAFTGQLERAAGEDVNSYVISQGNLLAANYSISFTGSNLTIDQATLNAKANDKTIIFGNPDPTFDITYTGFQFSENAAVLNSVPTCGVTGDHTAVGTYTISCSGGSDNNYAFTYSDGVLTVNPVPVAIFADVPLSYWANNHIERLYSAGITGGCSTVPLNYCPTKPVTRAQMAIFLVRAMHGVGFTPPSATGVFADVPVGSFGADFIEQLATDGITSGCGGGNFCPNSIVTRSQMAIFLVRAKHGIAFVPPTATGVFPDVPVGSFGADFIEQLVTDGVTSGCGGGLYCPSAMVKRDSMAVFLVKNFNLP